MKKQHFEDDPIVYIRAVNPDDLPEKLREQTDGLDHLYALHRADGSPVALVKDRQTAFIVARQNDLQPVSVH